MDIKQCKEKPAVDHLIFSVMSVETGIVAGLQTAYWHIELTMCMFFQASISTAYNLDPISVSELGNKSIMAWPSFLLRIVVDWDPVEYSLQRKKNVNTR